MNKFDFLTGLRAKLWRLSKEDAERSVEYYREMIDDRMEEGLTEEEAVADIGDLDEIVKSILSEVPSAPVVTPPPKKKRSFQAWEIILLILGSPIWVSLLIAVAAIAFSVYVALWSVVISLYAASVALGASAIGCIVGSFFMIVDIPGTVLVTMGAALLCAGLAVLMFLLSNLAARGMIALTKLTWKGIRRIFTGKEQAV